jgi:hypothetical protein
MLSPAQNVFSYRKVLIREHLGEWWGSGRLRAQTKMEEEEEEGKYIGDHHNTTVPY